MPAEDFYDRMDDVMSPEPLDPVKAMTDAITSLNEQIKTRVTSIENGRKYQLKQAGDSRQFQSEQMWNGSSKCKYVEEESSIGDELYYGACSR